MTELTKLEINKFLHTQIMEQCWHEMEYFPETDLEETGVICNLCGVDESDREEYAPNPDYCSDSSPRQLLNEVVAKVIAKIGGKSFENWLIVECVKAWKEDPSFYDETVEIHSVIEATAKQISAACVAAWKEKQND